MGKQTSLYLDEEIIKVLNKISKEQDRSLSYLVNSYLRDKLSKRGKR